MLQWQKLSYSPIIAVVLAASAAAQTDSSPHRVQMVTVEQGVQLEVLDWGGSGRPLIFLAGAGDTAHRFDGFAPQYIMSTASRGKGLEHPASLHRPTVTIRQTTLAMTYLR